MTHVVGKAFLGLLVLSMIPCSAGCVSPASITTPSGGTDAAAPASGGTVGTGGNTGGFAGGTGGSVPVASGGQTATGGSSTGGATGETGGIGTGSGGAGVGGAAGGGTAAGGTSATGGRAAGGAAAGGITTTGGRATGGVPTGGSGGAATGGMTGSGCAGGNNPVLNALLSKTMYWANSTTEAATWLLGGGSAASTVTRTMTAAGSSKFAVFSTYYSVNVNPDATGFATWIEGIARAIGAQPNPAVVALEADAFPGAGSNQAKHDMLNAAVGTLRQYAPQAAIFLDIGHSNWLKAQAVADKVKTYSNYALIDGWASNTSNFCPTPNEVAYAQQLWNLTCKPTIIDTSRNGLGKLPSTVHNPPANEWAVGASFAWWPDNQAVFFNYHNKPWNERD